MLKRIFALFFILILAGQVWASVCGCLDTQSKARQVSCCKSKKIKTKVAPKKCCASVCSLPASERSPRSSAEASMKIPAPVLAAVEKLILAFNLKPDSTPLAFISKRAGESPRLLFDPPDLYLKNHAFLI